MARTKLNVTGMTCNHCTHSVKMALEGVDGVRSARVDLEAGTALIDHEDDQPELAALSSAVAEAGYQVAEAE